MTRVQVQVHREEVRRVSRSPAAERMLRQAALPSLRASQRAAPRSKKGSHGRPPGYLASKIAIMSGVRSDGAFARVMTWARDPKRFPYGLIQQKRRPYLRPVKP